MAERIDTDELRRLIRATLEEALGMTGRAGGERGPPRRSAGAPPGASTDGRDHAAGPPLPQAASSAGAGRDGAHRFDGGVLGERQVAELGRKHARIVIGPGVAVTPLAREKAREIKVEIVRETP
jgi:hypothetical protein